MHKYLILICFTFFSFSQSFQNASSILNLKEFPKKDDQVNRSDFFSFDEPAYFLFGFKQNENAQVKFRVNIRYDLISFNKDFDDGIYVKFTQKSFWNLYNKSGPFYENNYNPEIYWYYDGSENADDIEDYFCFKGMSYRISLAHESNGLDDLKSREWDRIIWTASFGSKKYTTFFGNLSMWNIINDEENKDISTFVGFGKIELNYQPYFDGENYGLDYLGLTVSSNIFGGAHNGFNNLDIKIYWNPFYETKVMKNKRKSNDWKFIPSLMLEYFTGYGENLIDYKVNARNLLRVGVVFIR